MPFCSNTFFARKTLVLCTAAHLSNANNRTRGKRAAKPYAVRSSTFGFIYGDKKIVLREVNEIMIQFFPPTRLQHIYFLTYERWIRWLPGFVQTMMPFKICTKLLSAFWFNPIVKRNMNCYIIVFGAVFQLNAKPWTL